MTRLMHLKQVSEDIAFWITTIAVALLCLWLLLFAIRAAVLHVRANRKPRMLCPSCGQPAIFIRDRGFEDGSGLVFTCNSDSLCKYHGIYFYPDAVRYTKPTGGFSLEEHRIRRETLRELLASGGILKR